MLFLVLIRRFNGIFLSVFLIIDKWMKTLTEDKWLQKHAILKTKQDADSCLFLSEQKTVDIFLSNMVWTWFTYKENFIFTHR